MLTDFKLSHVLLLGVLLLAAGCAALPPRPAAPVKTAPQPPAAVPVPEPDDRAKAPAPRTLASLRLTEQARWLIETNKPDDAIRILEQAINLDPNNGRNYYFLAEAWLMKNNKAQAIEFNRLAGIYLGEDAAWMERVQQQKERIDSLRDAGR